VPLCPPQIPHDLGSNPGLYGEKPATICLRYGTASVVLFLSLVYFIFIFFFSHPCILFSSYSFYINFNLPLLPTQLLLSLLSPLLFASSFTDMTYTISVQNLKWLKMYLLSTKITVFWDTTPSSTNVSEEHGATIFKVEEHSHRQQDKKNNTWAHR
jgi:hypothetical protein